ncbi:amidase [Lampropedia puyangensis]|uniref:Amidase n=1 Tax=Lampropedia puyangensis TaxID=1330072 RepID=A0A4S8ENN1_9BURK|nr:amidase [Lampropedia puyangensis]THT95956.1 amidase [Lampropedia puyangensis]
MTDVSLTPLAIHAMSVRALGESLRNGSLTASEVLEHFLARIERLQPVLNAFTYIDVEGARAAARHSDCLLAEGKPRSLLEGIPVSVKDNIYIKGMPFVFGSPLFKDRIATHDELPIELLRDAGAILVGKTNLPEFASRGSTYNPVYGATGNPWNPELTTGGSSGGSVASVAAGMVPLSLGTDGGGSIRRPAGYTGLVGLKPTLSRIPRADGFTSVLYDCEVVGPIGRTVDDVRIMMSAIAKPHRRDQRSRGFAAMSDKANEVGPLRILYVPQYGASPVDPEIAASCLQACERFSSMGHSVTVGELPFDISPVSDNWAIIGNVCMSLMAQQYPDFKDKVTVDYRDRALTGDAINGGTYQGVIELLQELRSKVGEAFAHYDIIMTPTSAANPWPKNEPFPPMIDGQKVGPRGHAVFTNWVNACSHPGLALPAEPTASGMPIGFQLIADFGADDLLLDLASCYEAQFATGKAWPEFSAS